MPRITPIVLCLLALISSNASAAPVSHHLSSRDIPSRVNNSTISNNTSAALTTSNVNAQDSSDRLNNTIISSNASATLASPHFNSQNTSDRLNNTMISSNASSTLTSPHFTSQDISAWLKKMFRPSRGDGSPGAEMQCYTLFSGGLGIGLHVIGFYNTAMSLMDRAPLKPWRRLKWRIFNMVLALLSMLVSMAMSVSSMYSCHNSWEFFSIALMKLGINFSHGLVSVFSSWYYKHCQEHKHPMKRKDNNKNKDKINKDSEANKDGEANKDNKDIEANKNNKNSDDSNDHKDSTIPAALLCFLLPMLLCTICGSIGIFNIVEQQFRTNQSIRIVTICMVAIFGTVLVMLCASSTRPQWRMQGLVALVTFCFMLIPLFGDLVFAALDDNWTGVPSQSAASRFWLLFVAQRLTMLAQ